MASIVVSGDTSGAITIAAPAIAGTNTLTLPASTGTLVVTGGAQTIEFADGTVSAPSITNSGDTNTGIYFPAADTIAFTEGGVESMRITSAGEVLIGTNTSNSKKFRVYGSGDLAELVSTNSGSGGAQLDLKHESASPADGDLVGIINFGGYDSSSQNTQFASIQGVATSVSSETGELRFGTRTNSSTYNSSAMVLNSSGNLGIGTSSPSERLSVSGTTGVALSIRNSGDSNRGGIFTTSGASGSGTFSVNTTSSGYALTLGVDAIERMRITSTGNVGIGTSSPNRVGFNSDARVLTVYGTRRGIIELGSETPVVNDILGAIEFNGSTTAKAYVRGFLDGGDAGVIAFGTGNGTVTERMRITSAGALRIGTTGVVYSGTELVSMKATDANYTLGLEASTGVCLAMNMAGQSSGTLVRFDSSGSNRGTISTNGSTVSYNTSSDYRLKDNISLMTGALAVVGQLKPCTYTWKESGSSGQGFIAHELQEVVPDCVTGEKDAVDEDGKPVYQGIDTSFLVATLTAAIQEQQAIIADLKARIETLETK